MDTASPAPAAAGSRTRPAALWLGPDPLPPSLKELAEAGWRVERRDEPVLEEGEIALWTLVVADGRNEQRALEHLAEVRWRVPVATRVLLAGALSGESAMQAINEAQVQLVLPPETRGPALLAALGSWGDLAEANRDRLRAAMDRASELESRVRERTAMLARAKREWEATFDSLTTPVAVVDSGLRVRRANLAWAQQTAMSVAELIGQPCWRKFDRTSPCVNCPVPESSAAQGPVTRDVAFGERLLEVTSQPFVEGGAERFHVVSVVDVTEARNRIDFRLRLARQAAVGRLAGAVAHELNNPLSGVLAFAQLMRRERSRSSEDQESLQLIEDSAQRCKAIVESLQRFTGSAGEAQLLPVDGRQVLRDTLMLFRPLLKRRGSTQLVVRPEPEHLPSLLADAVALGHTLFDLLQHRAEALPSAGGRLEVGVEAGPQHIAFRIIDTAPPLDVEEAAALLDTAVGRDEPLGRAARLATGLRGSLTHSRTEESGNAFLLRLPLENEP